MDQSQSLKTLETSAFLSTFKIFKSRSNSFLCGTMMLTWELGRTRHQLTRRNSATTHCTQFFLIALFKQKAWRYRTPPIFVHETFIETEASSRKSANNMYLNCQGHHLEDEPAQIVGTDNTSKDIAARNKSVQQFHRRVLFLQNRQRYTYVWPTLTQRCYFVFPPEERPMIWL